MRKGFENSEADEMLREELEKEYEKETPETEMDIPEVEWASDIERIIDEEIRREEIEAAKEIVAEEKDLEARRAAGETTGDDYLSERNLGLGPKKREATAQAFFKSKGRNYGPHVGNMFENREDIGDKPKEMMRKKGKLYLAKSALGDKGFEQLLNRTVDGHKLGEQIDEDALEDVKSGEKK